MQTAVEGMDGNKRSHLLHLWAVAPPGSDPISCPVAVVWLVPSLLCGSYGTARDCCRLVGFPPQWSQTQHMTATALESRTV